MKSIPIKEHPCLREQGTFLTIFLLFLFALTFYASHSKAEGGQTEVTLIHTNNLHGEVEPCPT